MNMKKKGFTLAELLVVIGILVLLFAMWIVLRSVKKNTFGLICAANLRNLGEAMQQYANDYGDQYPTPDKWCDSLIGYTGVKKKHFFCKSTEDGSYSTREPIDEANFAPEAVFHYEYNDVEGQHLYVYSVKWCHYAINPNAKPSSPGDMVLLFETRHGWNQFGGPEILSHENHLELEGHKGCNILFNNGHVEFVKPKQFEKLKWKN